VIKAQPGREKLSRVRKFCQCEKNSVRVRKIQSWREKLSQGEKNSFRVGKTSGRMRNTSVRVRNISVRVRKTQSG